MHNTLKRINNKIKKMERRDLTEEQKKVLAALKAMLAIFQARQTAGLAFTTDDEAILNAKAFKFVRRTPHVCNL